MALTRKFKSKSMIDRISPGELPNGREMMTEILIDCFIQQRRVPTRQSATTIFVRTCARDADGVCDFNATSSLITPVCRQRVARESERKVWPDFGQAQRHWHGGLNLLKYATLKVRSVNSWKLNVIQTKLRENGVN